MKKIAFRAARIAILSVSFALSGVPAPCEGSAASPAGRVETEERDGAVAARRIYDEEGALVEESFFGADGRLSERRSYIRSADGRLAKVEARDAEGKLIGAIVYRYDGNGRLVGLSPSGQLGSGNAGMIASGAGPSASWASSGASLVVQRFDERGRPLRVDTVEGGKVVARSSYAYGPGAFPERSMTEDLKNETTTSSDFDDEGRILRRVETSKGGGRSQSEFRYDGSGRLVEERSRIKSSLIVRSLEYDGAGALIREETRIDGVVSEAIARADGVTAIERYHEGLLFVRSSYREGRKVKDEFYEDGVMTRSREYP